MSQESVVPMTEEGLLEVVDEQGQSMMLSNDIYGQNTKDLFCFVHECQIQFP